MRVKSLFSAVALPASGAALGLQEVQQGMNQVPSRRASKFDHVVCIGGHF